LYESRDEEPDDDDELEVRREAWGGLETKQLSNADSSALVVEGLITSSRASCLRAPVGRRPGIECEGTGEVCADVVVVSEDEDEGASSKSSISTSFSASISMESSMWEVVGEEITTT